MKLKFNGILVLLVVLMAQLTLRKRVAGVVSTAGMLYQVYWLKEQNLEQTLILTGNMQLKLPSQILTLATLG
jgi:hypothetical protein